MRVLMETTHPKDVNILKNIVYELEKEGNEVLLAARDKEGVFDKLDDFKIKYVPGTNYKGFHNKVIHIPSIELWLYKIAKKFKPDIIFGPSSLYAAHVSKLISKPYICFSDCEAEFKYTHYLTVPFVTKIFVPNGFKLDLGKKMERFNGYLELTYLHPKYFKPDKSVLEQVGLDKDEKYILLRISSLLGFHDVDVNSPLTDYGSVKKFIKELEDFGRVFVSGDEQVTKKLEEYKLNINPNQFMDFLNYASLYVGDGISVAAEAALLGVPSIYVSDEKRRWGFIEELAKEGVVFLTSDIRGATQKAKNILQDRDTKKTWEDKSNSLIKEKEDVVSFFIDKIKEFSQGTTKNI